MGRSIARMLLTHAFRAGGAAATNADAPDRNALQLHLQDLMLDNVDALEALKLNIQENYCISAAEFLLPIAYHQPQPSVLYQIPCLLQMVCIRCPATSDMAFASDAVSSGNQQGRGGGIQVSAHCSRCHQDWSAHLTPRLVHAHSNVLASLRATGCSPLDLLPSLMAAQCSNCSAAASLR